MTKNEKQQLATVARYIESGVSLIDSGRIHAGRESTEMAKVLVDDRERRMKTNLQNFMEITPMRKAALIQRERL